MPTRNELVIRKRRNAAPDLSPENFHVSFSNAVLGNGPAVISKEEEQGQNQDQSEQTDSQPESESEVAGSSEGVESSSADDVDSSCRKHQNDSENERGTSEDTTTTDSSKSSNAVSRNSKRKKLRVGQLFSFSADSSGENKTSSASRDDPESSECFHEPSNSVSSQAAESSKQENQIKRCEKSRAAKSDRKDATTATATKGDDGDSGWTLSEDYQLRGMKEDSRNPTWAEIADVLGKSKNEVKARWKTIKDQPHKPDVDLGEKDEGEDEHAHETTSSSKTLNKPAEGKLQSTKKKMGTPCKPCKPTKTSETEPQAETTIILSGEEASSDTDSDPDALTYGPDRERRQQTRYLHNHIYGELYHALIDPEPDEYFGPEDCRVLATVDSKWKRSKWLEMQANFYNVTGRMVPLEVIRDKCERAETAGGRQQQRGVGSSRGDNDGR